MTEPLALIVTVPFTVGEVFMLKAPLIVKLLNVVAEPPILPLPKKLKVPVPVLKVPLFVNEPPLAIEIVFAPIFNVEPEAIVKSNILVEKSKLTVTPEGIETTDVLEFGTPPHQLFASFQSSFESPIHVPLAFTVTETLVLVALSQPETDCEA